MAASRYGSKGFRTGRRGMSAIELSLAVSVIVGLLFVSMRIMSLPDVKVQTAVAPEPTVTTALTPPASTTETP